MTSFGSSKRANRYLFVFLFLFVSCYSVIAQSKEQSSEAEPDYKKSYIFSSDTFTSRIPVWENVLADFKGKAGIHYLEVGVSEGRSLLWMLENVATHPTARATCIDIFYEHVKERFLSNLEISGLKDKVTVMQGWSKDKLRDLPFDTFDIIYIDAGHKAANVLEDAVLSWPLLKDGGILIFDDYLHLKGTHPLELRPQASIDAFITAYRQDFELVHHAHQVIVKRRETRHSHDFHVGRYIYRWGENELRVPGEKNKIELSDSEAEVIKQLIKSRKNGETEIVPDDILLENEVFINLTKRLGLHFGQEDR